MVTREEYARILAEEQAARVKLAFKIAKLTSVALATIVFGFGSFYTVDQRERAVHTRMGAIVGVSGPGMHFKFPLVDGVKKLSVKTQTIRWEGDTRIESYSEDQQPAEISMTVNWSLLPDEKSITEAYTKYGSTDGVHVSVIVPSAQEGFKNIFGRYNSVNAIQKRAMLNAEVTEEVLRITKGKPVRIESVQIQDIAFSEAYENAVEARMTAQVNVEKKTQEKLTAQIAADMQVIQAEAEAKATKLQGDAEAAAIKAKADALASNARLVEYTAAQKWNGELPTTMVPGSSVPFVKIGQ